MTLGLELTASFQLQQNQHAYGAVDSTPDLCSGSYNSLVTQP